MSEVQLKKLFCYPIDEVKLISLLIPVYNEEKTLESLIERLAKVNWPTATEWVFVDDGSQDNSVAVLARLAQKYPQIKFLQSEQNGGKGAALRIALEHAEGQIAVIQDADLEYDPNELPTLINRTTQGHADVVYGSRFKKSAPQIHKTYHLLGNRLITLVSNLCSGSYFSDVTTCYKIFRTDILRAFALNCNRFAFEAEITAFISKFHLRVEEYPISYYPRSYAEGKKIGWRDGISTFWHIFKCNLVISRRACLKKEAIEILDKHHRTHPAADVEKIEKKVSKRY